MTALSCGHWERELFGYNKALCAGAKARLFADQPIDDRARGRAALPRTGRELREAHRALPWQEYLHPSDHFGILLELPLAATKAPRSPSARQQEHAS